MIQGPAGARKPSGVSAVQQVPDGGEDVAVERAVDLAEQRERLPRVAEERPQRPTELGADETEQQDPDVEQRHAAAAARLRRAGRRGGPGPRPPPARGPPPGPPGPSPP